MQQYDTLVGLAHDMGELAGEVGGADAERLMDESLAAEVRFAASRSMFLGIVALASGRAGEAAALLELAGQRAHDALAKAQVGSGWWRLLPQDFRVELSLGCVFFLKVFSGI